ncbi:hypothetical protein Y10_31120 [Neptunitalea sp. Y10]|uniref:Bile acid:Na+ symporter, BASS family n=2 Tax=Neptunitalea lumnitzerae TaxID=2965509 RepID=A0ABQ5MMX8_9FLAO|nr:hypothetical protein Y10_31120 [Neptunitalea sp. Y10]
MLLLTFTGIRITYKNIGRTHIQAALIVVVLTFIHYGWVKLFFPELAMVGFILGAAPTAAAAAVVANMMKLNVSFVTVSTVFSNIVSVIFIPVMLPIFIKEPLTTSPLFIVLQVFITLGIPLIIGQLITLYSPVLSNKITQYKPFSFVLFILNMFIASANCSHYIQNNATISIQTIITIAAITVVIGLINFKVGEWTAPKALKYESGLATGRKNTMFALWICLTYINPMIGLAPVFYIVFHNVYNSAQLWFLERKRNIPKKTGTN